MATRVLYPTGNNAAEQFIATAGQTVFTLAKGSAQAGFIHISWNGDIPRYGARAWSEAAALSGTTYQLPRTQLSAAYYIAVDWAPLNPIFEGIPAVGEVLVNLATGLLTFNADQPAGWLYVYYETLFSFTLVGNTLTLTSASPVLAGDRIRAEFYKDFDRLYAAIYGGTVGLESWTKLADGDTLLLKARKQADYPSGALAPWIMNRPIEDYGVPSCPLSTFDLEVEANDPYSSWYFNIANLPIKDMRVTILGEVDGNNVPITQVCGGSSQEDYMGSVLRFYQGMMAGNLDYLQMQGGGFFLSGTKQITFRNLLTKHIGNFSHFGAPANVEYDNCQWDYCNMGPHLMRDNRLGGSILIKDCKVANCDWRPCQIEGNNVTIQGTEIKGLSSAWADAIATGGVYLPEIFFGWGAKATGFWWDNVDLRERKNILVSNCTVDFTDSLMQPFIGSSEGNANDIEAVVENVRIEDCEFIGLVPWGNAVIEVAWAGEDCATPRSCSATGNTMTNCGSGSNNPAFPSAGLIIVNGEGATAKPSDCLVSDNTFEDCVNGPAVFLRNTSSSQVVKNNYTDSGLPTIASGAFNSAIVLAGCDNCTVYEKKQDFPTHDDVEDYTTDIDGYHNLITGKNPKAAKAEDRGQSVRHGAHIDQQRAARDAKERQRSRLYNKEYGLTHRKYRSHS